MGNPLPSLRFSKLSEPASERRQQLEDSLKLQQFSRDVEDEMQWIKERKPLAESNDFGKSLMGVQNLQRKHQVGPLVAVTVVDRRADFRISTVTQCHMS